VTHCPTAILSKVERLANLERGGEGSEEFGLRLFMGPRFLMLITQRCLDNDALATVKKIRLYTLEKYVKQIYFLIFLSRLRRACATGTGAGVFKI
jgi:hypothetical protein